MTKTQLKALCKKQELTRQDARVILRVLFSDNYGALSGATQIHPLYLREMLSYIKPFSVTAQQTIMKAALEVLNKKTKAS